MQVREIMTENPACCTPDTPLPEVARMMETNDCGCIPVVESTSGMKPVGTITDRDIAIRTVAANNNPMNMRASDIMTRDIATIKPQMSVEECFDVMEDREIRRVLVVDEQGKCCGIVAQADVVQSTANPVRTNKVIREISESAPSRNPRMFRGGRNNFSSGSRDTSFMSSSSLVPLLVGMGSGMAVMYLLNNWQDSSNRREFSRPNIHLDHENRMDLTNQESFGRYVDADEEVHRRQHDLEGRMQTLRTDPHSPVNENTAGSDDTKRSTSNTQSRSAGQGS